MMPALASPATSSRNYGLDIARSVAVLMVLFSHLLLGSAANHPVITTALVYMGQSGVELFFSLSGFLIGGLLIDLAERGPSPRLVLNFWFRRWMRTLPLYYAVLAWAVWYTGHKEPHAWLFLQNFYFGETKVVAVAWSLVLEEYFYFFVPLAMLALAIVLGGGVRLVAAVAALLILACTAGRLANAYGGLHMGWDVVHEHPFLRMDCAAYGVLAACLYRRYPVAAGRVIRRFLPAIALAVTLIVAAWGGVFVGVLTFPAWSGPAGFAIWGGPWFVIQHSVLDLVFEVAVVALFVVRPAPRREGATAWCVRWCSLLSYSIYLVHMLVIGWTDMHVQMRAGLAQIGLQLLATGAVAFVTYSVIERPFLALRDAVSRRAREVNPRRATA